MFFTMASSMHLLLDFVSLGYIFSLLYVTKVFKKGAVCLGISFLEYGGP